MPATEQTARVQRCGVSREGDVAGRGEYFAIDGKLKMKIHDVDFKSALGLAALRCRFSIQQATFALWA